MARAFGIDPGGPCPSLLRGELCQVDADRPLAREGGFDQPRRRWLAPDIHRARVAYIQLDTRIKPRQGDGAPQGGCVTTRGDDACLPASDQYFLVGAQDAAPQAQAERLAA